MSNYLPKFKVFETLKITATRNTDQIFNIKGVFAVLDTTTSKCIFIGYSDVSTVPTVWSVFLGEEYKKPVLSGTRIFVNSLNQFQPSKLPWKVSRSFKVIAKGINHKYYNENLEQKFEPEHYINKDLQGGALEGLKDALYEDEDNFNTMPLEEYSELLKAEKLDIPGKHNRFSYGVSKNRHIKLDTYLELDYHKLNLDNTVYSKTDYMDSKGLSVSTSEPSELVEAVEQIFKNSPDYFKEISDVYYSQLKGKFPTQLAIYEAYGSQFNIGIAIIFPDNFEMSLKHIKAVTAAANNIVKVDLKK